METSHLLRVKAELLALNFTDISSSHWDLGRDQRPAAGTERFRRQPAHRSALPKLGSNVHADSADRALQPENTASG